MIQPKQATTNHQLQLQLLFRTSSKALAIAGLIAAAIAVPSARATTINVTVPGTADIYLAGQPAGSTVELDTTVSNPAAPVPGLSLVAGTTLTFGVTGSTDGAGCTSTVPDGCSLFTTGPFNGISAYNNGPAQALIGLFLDGNVPAGTAPDGLASIDPTASSVSPGLSVVFFIGDGLTGNGTGSTQTFVVPAGATRLFLGTSDGAGQSFNNSGSFSVAVTESSTVSATPEPATWSLIFPAAGVIGLLRRRAQKQKMMA